MNEELFKEEEKGEWVLEKVKVSESRPSIRVSVLKEGSSPSATEIDFINKLLADIESLIAKASVLVLNNYSYNHFKNLGVSESLLVKDSTEAIAAAITLHELYFFNITEGNFEASFRAPWDSHHSFDIEHQGGEPICCSVNG